MRKLAGLTAVITGASAGIGLHVARALAGERMNLVLAARTADTLEAAAAELAGKGIKTLAVPTDVSDHAALGNLVERTLEQFGTIDVLVNNAGIETYSRYHELDVEDIVKTINVNLTSTLVLSRLVLPHMLKAGRGHIINMSSTAGKHGPPYGAAYGASKSAMIAFTESLRGEYHGTGSSASAICPGFTHDGGMYELMKQQIGRGTPVQMGATTAQAVARAVIKALRKDLPEIIVNRPPLRPVMVLAEISPRLGEWIVRRATSRFLRKVAPSRARKRTTEN